MITPEGFLKSLSPFLSYPELPQQLAADFGPGVQVESDDTMTLWLVVGPGARIHAAASWLGSAFLGEHVVGANVARPVSLPVVLTGLEL